MNNSLSPTADVSTNKDVQQKASHLHACPSLVIDMRKNRIRIHKQTLHLLGDPDFIQLLVNPQTQTFVIRCSAAGDYMAQKIHWKTISGKQCCELYSKFLMDTMSEAFLYLNTNKSYRITGKLYQNNKLAHFYLKDFVCLSSIAGESY